MNLHHIGYLVKDIPKAVRAFQALGFDLVSYCGGSDVIVWDESRGCNICFLVSEAKLDKIGWGGVRSWRQVA